VRELKPNEMIEVTVNGRGDVTSLEIVDQEEFMARGRVADCDCGLISCVCEEARKHKPECRFRKALTCAVGISCDEHGYDVCPKCDPCDCEK